MPGTKVQRRTAGQAVAHKQLCIVGSGPNWLRGHDAVGVLSAWQIYTHVSLTIALKLCFFVDVGDSASFCCGAWLQPKPSALASSNFGRAAPNHFFSSRRRVRRQPSRGIALIALRGCLLSREKPTLSCPQTFAAAHCICVPRMAARCHPNGLRIFEQ